MKHAVDQEIILARMAESRAELMTAYAANEPVRIRRVPRAQPPANAVPWFLKTPNAELIALAIVGVAILGLRRTVQTAVGAGLSASTHRVVSDFVDALRS